MTRNQFNLWRQAASNPSSLMLVGEIRRTLRGCGTVLDVGCGNNSPLRFLPAARLTGIDGYPPAVDEARGRGTHDEYLVGDVRQVGSLLAGRRFDACISLDVIEHLPKDEGWKMLDDLERLATRRVVIFTPNGFVPQHSHDGDLQEHLSGWTAEEMRGRGYRVYGMFGPKFLRGEYHHIKYRPQAFWVVVALLAHYGRTRRHPETAAAIYCVKELDR